MRLTGQEYDELSQALLDAVVDQDDLGRMLRRAGKRLQEIAAPGPMPSAINDVIEYAETRDWVDELVAAARAANPGNVRLLRVSAAMGLEPGGIRPNEAKADEALDAVTARLERMVDVQRGIADLGSFAAKLHELMRQVCAVEAGDRNGTGFLIGPETVLTNYHVVKDAIGGALDPVHIKLRFDYQRRRDGKETNGGVVFGLADDWMVHAEKYSDADRFAYDETKLPEDHELDFAVLRTREKVGRLKASAPVEAERDWLLPRAQAYEFPADSFLMVVQHPCEDPISFDSADDAVLRVNPNRTRVHYRINTLGGSSGSPVLDRKLELVALHHAGEPGAPDRWLPCKQQLKPAIYNAGIPIDRIQARMAEVGKAWVFGSEAP